MRNEKFDFDDILLEPGVSSNIDSRKNLIIKDENGMLPLFTAPMDTVIDETNTDLFNENGITSILPRTVDMSDITKNNIKQWFSYSLSDFEDLFLTTDVGEKRNGLRDDIINRVKTHKIYALIDIANGHISRLVDVVKSTKEIYGESVVLMVGNVANPETYKILSEAGASFIRIGIGNGCFTPNMEVQTKKDLIKIKDIKKGDFVYTHKGNLKEVIDTFVYEKEEDIIVVNNIESTKTHEYYVIEKKHSSIVTDENIHTYAKWISAEKLDKDKHLLIEL